MSRYPDEPLVKICEATDFGGPEVLRCRDAPYPEPAADGQVVVRIAAANVNPTDLSARSGAHKARLPDLKPPFVPGWDLAGTVADAGAEPTPFKPGDAILGMIPWVRIGGRTGAYAQAAAVDPAWLAPRPEALDEITAATVPLNALTARQALDLIGLPPGSRLLITGASGAVGSFATQLAVADGLHVLAVATNDDEQWVQDLGAHEVLPRDTDLTALETVDGVLDAVPVGASATAPVKKNGVALFVRRVEVAERPDLTIHTPLVHSDAATLDRLAQQVAKGELKTRIDRTLDLCEAAEAHRLVERGGLRGKVVLTT
jgi:NADPH2:quinone reductase